MQKYGYPHMIVCMRTTLDLDDVLMRRAKTLAARQGTTLTAVMERALHDLLDDAERDEDGFTLELPVVTGRALPAVDITDRDALFEAME